MDGDFGENVGVEAVAEVNGVDIITTQALRVSISRCENSLSRRSWAGCSWMT